jgi:hypothetical protein
VVYDIVAAYDSKMNIFELSELSTLDEYVSICSEMIKSHNSAMTNQSIDSYFHPEKLMLNWVLH